ncbi:MAG: amino acid adenylation domain-containing protein, partial [Candidatus Aminicenantes bacterium]|nr:amino acid adenylation domain-containing protein [Candidatus Aminicenantes bacterium]
QLASSIIGRFIRPFDLSQAPLLRVGLIKLFTPLSTGDAVSHILVVDQHHIISDGQSVGIMIKEFISLLKGENLPPVTFQYKDYSEWQSVRQWKNNLDRQEAFWLGEFAGEIPVLDLPTDFPRPAMQDFAGKHLSFELSNEEIDALKALALQENATLYMVLLAVLNILLSKLSGQQDIIVGTPVVGRRHEDLTQILGMFVNTLTLRNNPSGEKRFLDFLREARDRASAAFENQEYPFEELVERVAVNRDTSRNPIFDVMLAKQDFDLSGIVIPGLKLVPLEYESNISKFDLTLQVLEVEEKLQLSFEYCTKLFREATILRYTNYFRKIVSTVITDPEMKITGIEIISDEEKQDILNKYNNTRTAFTEDKTIQEIFAEQVAKNPHKTALVYENNHLSFEVLNRKSNRPAQFLRSKGLLPGTIVGIIVERSLEMVTGILGILKSGGAYMPVNPDYPGDRIRLILKDSGTRFLVTDRPKFEGIDFAGDVVHIGDEVSYPGTGSTKNLDIVNTPLDLVYVIYTSGSTGTPKGTLIEHRSVVNILENLEELYPLKEYGAYLLKTNYMFDVSVTELFGWIFGEGKLVILEAGKEGDSEVIAAAVRRGNVTHINFVPSMLNVFLDSIAEDKKGIPESLEYVLAAGEAFPESLAKRAAPLGTAVRFENIYGPTEATIYTTGYSLDLLKEIDKVPIGKPLHNIGNYIVNGDLHLQALNISGELCIGGVGLARGYLNRPELTRDMFIDNPFIEGEKLYRTGDLTRWLADGNIEFLGRIDHQVKIRGFRIELEEIENQLLSHAKVKEVVVTAGKVEDGDTYICAYIVAENAKSETDRSVLIHQTLRTLNGPPRRGAQNLASQPEEQGTESSVGAAEGRGGLAPSDLRQYLSQTLPSYMLPSHFMFIDNIPLNPNGKVDRKALPVPETAGIAAGEYVPPGTDLEEKLVTIWSEVLKIDRLLISIDSNFFEIGGHSLKAIRLITKVHRKFDVIVRLAEFFKKPTIKWLSAFIEKTLEREVFVSIQAAEEKPYYPLSPSQKRFFFFQQLNPDNISYNISEILLVIGRLKEEKFSETINKLIHRHESLRTSFEVIGGQPVQKVHKSRDIVCEIEYYSDVCEAQNVEQKDHDNSVGKNERHAPFTVHSAGIVDRFNRPFNLSRAPLLRFGLIKQEKEKHILMMDMHHIISDGTSSAIFIADFLAIYKGEELSPLRVRYRDYVYWLLKKKKEGRGTGQEIDTGSSDGENELLELPTDYIRPAVQSFAGAKVTFEIEKEDTQALIQLSLRKETTLYMVLFAIFNIFLSRLSGQENIIVGSPTAGRLQDDLEGIMGLFINTLAIRSYPTSDKSFNRFLKEVRKNSLRALEEQDYQYETLVEKIEEARDSSRNPLFDVMFVLQNMEMPVLELSGLKIKRNLREQRSSKFDMTLYCEEVGDKLVFHLEYCTKLFKPGTIAKYISYFKKISSVVLADPTVKIGEIEFITGEEKREILYDFNDTNMTYPRDKTIYRLFEEQAARTPEKTALLQSSELNRQQFPEHAATRGRGELAYPVDQETNGTCLTYKQLNERANRLARVLRAKGVKANSIVGIMLERSVELIESLYAVLKTGGAYLPIDPEYPESRILSMLDNSQALILLTGKEEVRKKNLPPIPQEIVKIDEISGLIAGQPAENLQPLSQPTDLIYVIFTSGSTGIPKGAGVYQRSFVNLMSWFVTDFALTDADINLLMTSFSFDLTQKNLYASLILGGMLCLPAINYFDPGELLREIEEKEVTWINCTPSMFFQLIEFCKDAEFKKLETLRYIYLGGEPISMGMFMKWLDSEYCHGEIVNTYGPTECTDISNSFRITEPRRFLREPVPIGAPIYNVRMVVADRNLRLLPVGIAGELLISGDSVGIGYINDRELTEEKFVFCSFETGKPGRLFYRTGDLVKWLPDGTVEFIGRMDNQVKIRGFRIETGEIENCILDQAEIKEAVVIDRDDGSGGKYLCAYFVSSGSSPATEAELREHLSRTLPDYMIPSYFVELPEMPLNPNGKVDRKALPAPDTSKSADGYTAPRDEIEKKLEVIWSEILKIQPESIGIDTNFFHAGGHSLRAAQLTARIHKEFDVSIKLAEIFTMPTIRKISIVIGSAAKVEYLSFEAVEDREYYPLSSAQKRLYFLQQMNPGSTGYHIPAVMLLEGDLQKERLQDTSVRLIRRHESLRTSFFVIEEEPVQGIKRPHDIKFKIEYIETGGGLAPAGDEMRDFIDDFIRPFDLSAAPLLRTGLIPLEDKTHILMVDMHHIISDGISLELFNRELTAHYSGKDLPQLNTRYKDYSEWQNSAGEKTRIGNQEEYWMKQFDGEVPVLELPYDFPRPSVKSFVGSVLFFEINEAETAALNSLALDRETTLYMVFLAIYYIFLSKICGREDIVIGTPTAGRMHEDLEPIIGMFVNTLALRNYPEGDKSFRDFLQEVKIRTLETFENQDYQFEDLIEKLGVNRDMSRNPLFDVMFSLQNLEMTEIKLPGLRLIPYEYEEKTSKFDLVLMGSEMENRLVFSLQYSTKLFKKERIERFIGYFKSVTAVVSEAVLAGVEIKISGIEILSKEERRQLLYEFNDTATSYPKEKTIQALFEEQVEKKPDNIAVVGANYRAPGQSGNASSLQPVYLTYKQLNLEAGRLAGILVQKGVGCDTIVVLLAKRSLEMMVGIFAILKAGGAYLPMEPQSPEARKRYMVKESKTRLLLTTQSLTEEVDKLKELPLETIYIEEGNRQEVKGTDHEPAVGARRAVAAGRGGLVPEASRAGSGSLAYIIYTSGTTGKPKGILTMHYNVVRVVKDTNYIDFKSADKALQLSNYAFDGSVFDIYGALLNGAALVLVEEEKVSAVAKLADLIRREKITVFFITTALFNTLVELKIECFENIRKVLFGGERVSVEHSKKALEYMGKGRILHVYGPTETTVYASYYPIDHIEERDITIPIGRPIANTSLFVLDKDLRPVPTGVQGELYVGGDGLARGYMNRPELTAENFINPGAEIPSAGRVPRSGGVGSEVLYKTGDLVCWNHEGNIEFIGRIDDQVKVRGFRIELGEIENRLLSFSGVEEALVLAKEYKGGDRYLCAYVVMKGEVTGALDSTSDVGELRKHLSQSLPDYMVPSYFTFLEKMPLTANGKIDRKALPEPEMKVAGVYVAPRDDVEKRMGAVWSEVLGIEEEKIGIDDNFFELGGHSLNAAKLVYFIRKEFEVNIELKEVFANPCIRELAQFIKAAEAREYIVISAVEEKEYYELSYNQKRLWVLHQLEPLSPAFNMPARFELRHKVDIKAFKKALHRLMMRHDSLRTKFEEINEKPFQSILKQVEMPFEEIDISALSEARKKERTDRILAETSTSPFTLTRAPLFRIVLIKLAEEQYEFICNLHHIITDGWSMEIITNEFFLLDEGYRTGRQVKPAFLELQYKDFCQWSNERIKDPVIKNSSHSYWQAKLAGGIPALELPVRSSGDKEDLQGAAYMVMIDKELSERLIKMAADSNTTLFVVMFSLYIMMLYRFSKQQDIVCSIIGAGREHLSLHNIIGFFVNSMFFRIEVSPGESFSDFLQRMQAAVIETFQYQGYPLELVCRDMKIKHPDIPVSFNMLNILKKTGRPRDSFEPYHIEEVQDVKFDLEPYVSERPDSIDMYWVYRRNLFKPENIEHIVNEYIKIIDFFTGNSHQSYEDFHKRVKKKKIVRR